MEKMVDSILDMLRTMEPMQMIVILILLAIIAMGWYYLTQLHPRSQEVKEKHDAKMIEIEERRSRDQESTNTYLRDASNTQHQLLNQNTEAVKDLKKIMEVMAETFRVVSEKLAVHDANSAQANKMIADMYRDMPSQAAIIEMHSDIRDMAKASPDRQDIEQVINQLEKLSTEIGKANNTLGEIKMRQIAN